MTTSSNDSRKVVTNARRILDQKVVVRVKHLLGVIVVGFIVFAMITFQIRTLGEGARRADFNAIALSTYQVELANYQTAATQYEACLARIETRDAIRARFFASANTKRQIIDIILGDNVVSEPFIRMYNIIDQEIADIETDLPSLILDETCPPPPVAPELELRE